MSKELTNNRSPANDDKEFEESLNINVNLIEDNLYLGNLSCAKDIHTLETLLITHILTLNVVPLPKCITDRPNLICRHIRILDTTKQNLLEWLPETYTFIKKAIDNGGIVLVHCHFGVSRSAAVVIGYIMQKHELTYENALTLIKKKRIFVGPNKGFIAQLKLYEHMGYTLIEDDPRYKQFRLKIARQKLKDAVSPNMTRTGPLPPSIVDEYKRQMKIQTRSLADLIKPHPTITHMRLDRVVYRCRKCQRIIASQRNIIPHIAKTETAKLPVKHEPSSSLNFITRGKSLIEQLKSLAAQIVDLPSEVSEETPGTSQREGNAGSSQILSEYSDSNMVDSNVASQDNLPEVCHLVWFVEPMSWMRDVAVKPSGRLLCPRCSNQIGGFNWILVSKCPCGQKLAPAFYMLPTVVDRTHLAVNASII